MSLRKLFWSEWFWLPNGTTWEEFAAVSRPGEYKPRLADLWLTLACAVAIHCARLAVESCLLRPIGRRFGLREKPSRRLRRAGGGSAASKMQKFVEAGWHGCFYLVSSIYGGIVLWDKDYLWDTRLLWRDWPHHAVPGEIFWYYMLELGYYWAALFAISFESKRKDFREMVLHHLVTIWLMMFSWAANFVRIGALVLLVHDVADPFLQGAKVAKYLSLHGVCNAFFGLFTLVWLLTRLSAYPLGIVRSSLWQSVAEFGMFPAHVLFNGALLLLQCLHIVWFYFIVKLLVQALRSGTVEKDSRSDSEMSDEAEASGEEGDPATRLGGPQQLRGSPASNGSGRYGNGSAKGHSTLLVKKAS